MNLLSVLLLFLVVNCECMSNSSESQCSNVKINFQNLRKRRHLTFPDTTSVVLTISLVKAFMTHAPSGWNIALEIDVLFPLPDEKFTNRYFRRKLHHKQKRELWEKIQRALEFYNINGQACIIRGICESKSYLAPPGKSLVHDLLRVVFSVSERDEELIEAMKGYYDFSNPKFCEKHNDCPISLLEFILALNKH